MWIPAEIVTAIIAASVSLVVSLVTYTSVSRRVKAERESLKHQLQTKFTERLYDVRLEHYPVAFEITERIMKRGFHDVGSAQVQSVLDDLSEWYSREPSVTMSRESLEAYYELRQALKRNPGKGTEYDAAQLSNFWRLRNRFRGCLRRDLGLLFDEDGEDDLG